MVKLIECWDVVKFIECWDVVKLIESRGMWLN